MKLNRLFILAMISCIFLMTSCQSMTEEITIELDGSGKYNTYCDIIPMLTTIVAAMDSVFAFPDSTGNVVRKSPAEIQESVWQDFSEDMDSTMDFMSNLPDSIKDDANKMAILEKTKIYTKGGKSKGYVEVGMEYSFDHLDKLKKFNNFKDNEIDKTNKSLPLSKLEKPETKTDYVYTQKSFKRIFKVIKKGDYTTEDLAFMQATLNQGIARTVLRLPKEIEEVKGDYLKSVDGKTVIFEYPMLAFSKGDLDCSFEVVFK